MPKTESEIQILGKVRCQEETGKQKDLGAIQLA